MKIDNSAANAWAECPAKYQEVYIDGWQRANLKGALAFGSRVHELLEAHLLDVPEPDPAPDADMDIEAEALEMLEHYKAYYPVENFDVVEVERYFEVPLPESEHVYVGKIDGVVRDRETGRLQILEHKTESRSSKANLPEVWAAKPQVSLYLWAGGQIYNEPFESIILDVLTRRSPAGRVLPSFRRDTLQRSEEAMRVAVRNITWIANQIERMKQEYPEGMWPQFRGNCNKGGWKCDFYSAHVVAESQVVGLEDLIREKHYEKAEEYLKP
jgi:hypothetical protein